MVVDTQTLLFILSALGVHFLAVASPGPDFVVTVRNALSQGRSSGLATAFGILLANFIHVGYSLGGVGLLVSQSETLFTIVRYIGAVYLIYIGIMSFRAKTDNRLIESEITSRKTVKSSAKNGFLTSVLNPKATLYYIMMFSVIIDPGNTSGSILAVIASVMLLIVIAWFSLVAVFFTQPAVRRMYEHFQGAFNKLFGVALIALGLKVALDS